jgi:type I restriction enzyme R subunit
MTTRLAGPKTFFLPFNMGDDGGAGNPINPNGSATSYLWERVLHRDSWLHIVGKLMHVEKKIDVDPITGAKSKSTTLLFPRFHQWDVVTKLLGAARTEGPGHRYLAQHSAGSGKTNSIAWTAHGLATLYDEADEKVFDSVIVVTDRTVLDDQLQEAIKQIEPRQGMVVSVTSDEAMKQLDPDAPSKSKSALLAKALSEGRHIVVVTLQTFPFAMQAIRENKGLKGKRFAVIADEAHSSQTGMAAAKLKQVLTAEEIAEGVEIDTEDILTTEMTERAASSNISYFAFTATPKPKTLELFGRPGPDGLPTAFHHYTMQQAIEEGFILDVLRNYTPYKTAWQIAVDEEGEVKQVDQSKASTAVVRWVKLHPTNIAQKVAIIVEHFRQTVAPLLEGHAKAMVVCDSRKAAVRYKHAFDKYVSDKGYSIAALVAFSGEDVPGLDPEDGPGPFNERTLNPGLKGRDLRTAFKTGDEYRVMLVANKFQTGFDEPLLCAMYVDKRLSGVTAVQTLSRLNRTYSKGGKTNTYVLDFVNDPAEILASFKPYYRQAELTAATDPNLVHDLQNKLDTSGLYTDEEVVAVSDVIVTGGGNNKLDAAIAKPVRRFLDRWKQAVAAQDKPEIDLLTMFRKDVEGFVRLYDFLSQIINYGDTELERRSIFFRLLARRIQTGPQADPIDISDVSLVRVRQRVGQAGDLPLGKGDPVKLKPITGVGTGTQRDRKLGKLAEVVARLNELFGDDVGDGDQQQSWVEAVLRGMLANETLVAQAKINTPAQFLGSPDLKDAVTEVVMDNQTALNKIADVFYGDQRIRVEFIEMIGGLFHMWATSASA